MLRLHVIKLARLLGKHEVACYACHATNPACGLDGELLFRIIPYHAKQNHAPGVHFRIYAGGRKPLGCNKVFAQVAGVNQWVVTERGL